MTNPLDTLTPAELRTELGAAVLELDRKQDIIAARDAEIERYKEAYRSGIKRETVLLNKCTEQLTEIARLREALEGVADDECCHLPGCCTDDPMCTTMLARAALAQTEWPTTGETGVNNGTHN